MLSIIKYIDNYYKIIYTFPDDIWYIIKQYMLPWSTNIKCVINLIYYSQPVDINILLYYNNIINNYYYKYYNCNLLLVNDFNQNHKLLKRKIIYLKKHTKYYFIYGFNYNNFIYNDKYSL